MGNSPGQFGYTSKTTALEVLKDQNLENKHYFVTGANAGIGLETSRALYYKNGVVTLACRNQKKMEAAKEDILSKAPEGCKGKIHTIVVDLFDPDSISKCVEEFKERNMEIDVLINNAGLLSNSKKRSKDGCIYILTMGLLPTIKEGGRIVMLSSAAHKGGGGMDLENLYYKDITGDDDLSFWEAMKMYCVSKLCNLFYAKELDRIFKKSNKKISTFSVHPGGVNSNFGDHMNGNNLLKRLKPSLIGRFGKNNEQGAATSVFCATSGEILTHSGKYFSDCDLGSVAEHTGNDKLSDGLWKTTVKLTGIDLPFTKE